MGFTEARVMGLVSVITEDRKGLREENTEGFEEGYKCVKKTKDKIGLIKCCVVLPKTGGETRGDRYGDKEGEKA